MDETLSELIDALDRKERERRLKVIEDWLLGFAKNTLEAREFALHLASVDWDQVIARQEQEKLRREQEQQKHIEDTISKGGGFCDECHKLAETLHSFPYKHPYAGAPKIRTNWPGRYCLKCIREFEDVCDVPYAETLWRCANYPCLTVLPAKLLVRHPQIEDRGRGYCSSCLEQLIERNSIVCITCGQKTLDYTYYSKDKSLCKNCYVKPPAIQAVNYNNSRARSANLPATLTDAEWEQAINHFSSKCAYCGVEPYQVLEHFHPLSLGVAGTTINNCVPACAKCNALKGNKHPSEFERLFPRENIERIRVWFEQKERSA